MIGSAMTITDQIIKSNKTSRDAGAIGANAIVPKWVAEYADKSWNILDFGCGKSILHVQKLIKSGFSNISGYDFGNNVTDSHIKELSKNKFDLVYASNVFNTHSTALMSAEALHLIKDTLKDRGHFIFNLPKSPNYFWTNTNDFLKLVIEIFGDRPIKVDARGIFAITKDIIAEKYLLT
jgi:hypothetical protein